MHDSLNHRPGTGKQKVSRSKHAVTMANVTPLAQAVLILTGVNTI